MEHFYIASNYILGVKTNIKDFQWSYGLSMPEGTEAEYKKCKVRIHLVKEDFNDDFLLEGLGKYHYFSGEVNGDKLYYTRELAMNKKLRIKAENLLTEEPKITVNNSYYRLITHRIMNLHSISYILTDLACLLLLKKGFAPIHCSAFKKGNSTVAVFGPPNSGKTLTSVMACKEHGARFISEDLAITDGKDIYSVPWTDTFRFYSNVDQTIRAKIKNKIARILPPLVYISFSKPAPIINYIDKSFIADRERVTHIAFLERGSEGLINPSSSEAVRKLMNLNRNAFNYLRSPLLLAYEFFNPELNIDEGLVKERKILSNLVSNADRIFLIRNNNALYYTEKVISQIRTESLVQ